MLLDLQKMVNVFDMYYDRYGKGSVQKIDYGHGTVNPSQYGYKPPEKERERMKDNGKGFDVKVLINTSKMILTS